MDWEGCIETRRSRSIQNIGGVLRPIYAWPREFHATLDLPIGLVYDWHRCDAVSARGRAETSEMRYATGALQILWLVVKCFGRFCVNSLGIVGGFVVVERPAQLGHLSGYGAGGLDRGEAFGLLTFVLGLEG